MNKWARHLAVGMGIATLLGASSILAQRSSAAAPIADVIAGAARLDFVPRQSGGGFVLTVSGPDGVVEQKQFDAGRPVMFTLSGPDGGPRRDGIYVYELRSRQAPAAAAIFSSGNETADGRLAEVEASAKARASSNDSALSGTFRILNGSLVTSGAVEPRGPRVGASSSPRTGSGRTALDVVTPDDAIIQGSLCVGLDCVNGEVFGFDSIRIKENNTRIQFDDTSAVGFPTNNWQIRANSSSSGGANFLGFVDQGDTGNSETGTVVFQVTAGAPANSLVVDSTGRVGFRTATPVLDLHASTSNTPALRLEQTSAGGFTAQTWDIAGNEANFFVRDVTGGSRLPFRIRPGAPTSSIDISASGNVGIGTASPTERLNIVGGNLRFTSAANPQLYCEPLVPDSCTLDILALSTGSVGFGGNGAAIRLQSTGASADGVIMFSTNQGGIGGGERVRITNSGRVGIGTTTPSFPLQMASGAFVSVGGVWTNASSREYKRSIQNLSLETAEETLLGLTPVTYEYKSSPGEHHIGFIAEDVPEIIATSDRKGLSSMDIVGVLTKVVQEQQKTIRDLTERLERVEVAGK